MRATSRLRSEVTHGRPEEPATRQVVVGGERRTRLVARAPSDPCPQRIENDQEEPVVPLLSLAVGEDAEPGGEKAERDEHHHPPRLAVREDDVTEDQQQTDRTE